MSCCSRSAPARAIGVFGLLAFQKRLPRDTVFEWSIIGAGICLAGAAAFNEGGLAAVMIAGVGACAGAAYVTGFTVLQETVTDELRGRTFATLYAVVRLCLLLSLTVSPLFADLYEWLFSLAAGEPRITLGGFNYGFPGVRLALWGGAVLTIASGLYARHELKAMRSARRRAAPPGQRPPLAAPQASRPTDPPPEATGRPDRPDDATGCRRRPTDDRALRRPGGRRRQREEHADAAARRVAARPVRCRRRGRRASPAAHRSAGRCGRWCSRVRTRSTRPPRRCSWRRTGPSTSPR